MIVLVVCGLIACIAYLVSVRMPHDLHMMQQHSYRNERYWRWYKLNRQQERRISEVLLVFPLIFSFINGAFAWTVLILLFAFLIRWNYKHKKKVIKPLVWTNRIKRLYAAMIVLAVLVSALLCWLAGMVYPVHNLLSSIKSAAPGTFLCIVVFWLLCANSFAFTLAANYILLPIEKRISLYYYNDAKKKIRAMANLHTVAVTGSYGKTSVKKITESILSEQYLTLATPESYNTPMGIARIIREQLRPIHQMFVCEMGAREKGDIKELAELVAPQIGILTAIGEQHLETFGSINNIIDTKFELIRALPDDGVAVVNMDNEHIAQNIGQAACRVVSFGLSENCDYRAEQISYNGQGSSFTICVGEQKQLFTTRLLGKHNIYNILAAVAAVQQLGISLDVAARAVKRISPVEHRLELRDNLKYTVIDDAYNANPAGAAAALDVLALIDGGQKIIITPGMVELGEKEQELNYKFAEQMIEVGDYIIIVGKKRGELLEPALIAHDFPQKRYYIAGDLREARIRLSQIVQPGDVVLYENDLPDMY